MVGRGAWLLGQLSQQAEDLGDRIGPNDPGAANHCYAASGMLRTRAVEAKIEWQESVVEETRRLENLEGIE